MQKFILIVMLPCVFEVSAITAQQLISSAGTASMRSSTAQFSWSLGEIQTQTAAGKDVKVTQGQQQPKTTTTTADIVVYNGLTINDNNSTNNSLDIKDLDKMPNNKLVIVNRWGETLFSAQPYTRSNLWHGTAATGNFVESGTYYYVFYPDAAKTQNFKGYIFIVNP